MKSAYDQGGPSQVGRFFPIGAAMETAFTVMGLYPATAKEVVVAQARGHVGKP